jgi:Fe-S oxidoreductase
MGLIYWWARLAARAPRLANFVTQTPPLSALVKAAGGIAPQRRLPRFAPEPFTAWFRRRDPVNADGPRVLLWPDTFNTYFHPATARAAVEALEAAGFRVAIPEVSLCCGRPLYDWGMLGLAGRLLRQILDALRDDIAAGVPVVGLEPSCVSVFRDELIGLFPHDEDARRLSRQTYLLGEFLELRAADHHWPRLRRKALLHGHCHQKAVLSMDAAESLLKKLGVDYTAPDTGCCGMAGAFGFERGDHYDVAMKCGERVLLPAVRRADADTLIVADGFSCRTQIVDGTRRTALHTAQVLQRALQGNARDGEGHARGVSPRQPGEPIPVSRND